MIAWLASAYAADQEILYKARILAGIVTLYAVLLLLTCVYMVVLAPLSLLSILVASSLLLMMGGYLYILRLLKFRVDQSPAEIRAGCRKGSLCLPCRTRSADRAGQSQHV